MLWCKGLLSLLLSHLDPRMWNKWEVMEWLKWATERYSIRDITADKFLMNGKGLCMLGVEGFLYRVPRGGDVLHGDFNKRVTAAVEQSRHMQSYLNPGASNFYYVYWRDEIIYLKKDRLLKRVWYNVGNQESLMLLTKIVH